MSELVRAPFPYPGGKSRIAELFWSAVDRRVPAYVELACGSSAVLLARPGGAGRYETINDASGFVANVWRALRRYPADVAQECKGPPCELDLQARTLMLRQWGGVLTEQLSKDPEWCDPKAAAWWIWCQCLAVDPWWIDRGTASACKGSRKGIFGLVAPPTAAWFQALSRRLEHVLITCGDWSRVTSETALGFNTTGTTPVAIFADPPYADEALDYGAEPDVARRIAAWCLEHGNDPRLRIVLAGHVGDYELPGWRVVNWGASRGHGREKRGDNEALWFSPHCLPLDEQRSLFDGSGAANLAGRDLAPSDSKRSA